MSEDESPPFTVVDRRAARVKAGKSEREPESKPAGETETPSQEHSDAVPEPSDSPDPDSTSEQGEEGAEADDGIESQFDPASLMLMGAMAMDARSLARVLIGVFDAHAWKDMGLVADRNTGEVKQDLPAARLAIDCVEFLVGKLQTEMPETARRDTQRRLSDLRMNYLSKSRAT